MYVKLPGLVFEARLLTPYATSARRETMLRALHALTQLKSMTRRDVLRGERCVFVENNTSPETGRSGRQVTVSNETSEGLPSEALRTEGLSSYCAARRRLAIIHRITHSYITSNMRNAGALIQDNFLSVMRRGQTHNGRDK